MQQSCTCTVWRQDLDAQMMVHSSNGQRAYRGPAGAERRQRVAFGHGYRRQPELPERRILCRTVILPGSDYVAGAVACWGASAVGRTIRNEAAMITPRVEQGELHCTVRVKHTKRTACALGLLGARRCYPFWHQYGLCSADRFRALAAKSEPAPTRRQEGR